MFSILSAVTMKMYTTGALVTLIWMVLMEDTVHGGGIKIGGSKDGAWSRFNSAFKRSKVRLTISC